MSTITGEDMILYHLDHTKHNVIDKYKGLPSDAIKEDLSSRRSNFVLAFENICSDFNLGTCIRNLNAFCGESILIFGRRRWDKRSAVGTHHYENIEFHPTFDVLNEYKLAGYRIVAAENNVEFNPVSITEYAWPEKVVVLFGEEMRGLSEEAVDLVDDVVYIPQRGSVRSMNVGTAAGIFLYDYSMKTGLI